MLQLAISKKRKYWKYLVKKTVRRLKALNFNFLGFVKRMSVGKNIVLG